MVTVPNKIAMGLENIGKEPDVEVPREILDEMQAWVEELEYDDNLSDIHRVKEFDGYTVDRENFNRSEDDVTVTTDDKLASVLLSDFLEL